MKETADTTGQKIASTLDTFLRLKTIQSALKATDAQLLTFTDNVSKLGVASGAGPQALESSMVSNWADAFFKQGSYPGMANCNGSDTGHRC